jgi:hypothetical protein
VKRDTMRQMAERHHVTMQTIWRVKNGQPTSYGLRASWLTMRHRVRLVRHSASRAAQ